jgi:2-polyprenyl-3-methyl-5-hydroxy-6-metoxy-1,4-benzoquinol methylase
MTRSSSASTPQAVFDALYARDSDPWNFETSPYEQAKYQATLAALPARNYGAALEVGCSIGVLSRLLAQRCAALTAIDFAEQALVAARLRFRDLPQVRFLRAAVPAEWPAGRFDLIVLSEVLYFLSAVDIRRTARCVSASIDDGGVVLLVNYLGHTDTACDGDTAAELFIRAAHAARSSAATSRRPLAPLRQCREPHYRLDLLARSG